MNLGRDEAIADSERATEPIVKILLDLEAYLELDTNLHIPTTMLLLKPPCLATCHNTLMSQVAASYQLIPVETQEQSDGKKIKRLN